VIGEQLTEDISYYRRRNCRALVVCVFDPEKLIRDPEQMETAWAGLSEELHLRPVIAS
jgi:hypothetical protein